MDRATADYMGMLATVMNALALADTMEKAGLVARVMSTRHIDRTGCGTLCPPQSLQYLEEGKVVIFAAGTGNPFFTTDTAAALRGAEIGAEVVLKATKVDGVYSADPKRSSATLCTSITFDEPWARTCRSWTQPHLRCAATRNCPSKYSASSSTVPCAAWCLALKRALWCMCKTSRECDQ